MKRFFQKENNFYHFNNLLDNYNKSWEFFFYILINSTYIWLIALLDISLISSFIIIFLLSIHYAITLQILYVTLSIFICCNLILFGLWYLSDLIYIRGLLYYLHLSFSSIPVFSIIISFLLSISVFALIISN